MGPAEIHGTVRNLWGLLRSVGLGGTCEACCHLWGWEELVGPAVTYGGCNLWGLLRSVGLGGTGGACCDLWGCNLWGPLRSMGQGRNYGAC